MTTQQQSDEAVGRGIREAASRAYWEQYGYCIVCGRDAGQPCWSALDRCERGAAHFYRERVA